MNLDGFFRIRPVDAESLWSFTQMTFGLAVPRRAVCAGHGSPMDYLASSFFGQRDLLVWANRGGGKTFVAAVATLLDAIYRAPAKILVLGGSFDQSDRLADYIRELLMLHPELLDGEPTKHRVRLVGGSEIRMLPQSQQAVRGQHVQKIRCDEVDLFDEDIWRAVQFSTRTRRTSSGDVRGTIEVLSTLHRPGGLMRELVNSASRSGAGLADEPSFAGVSAIYAGGYQLIRWCLWDVIERCPDERRCEDCPLAEDCRGAARQADGFYSIDDAIAIKARSSRAAWEAEMLCLGTQREHRVFGDFNAARHVRELPYVPAWPTYRAIDFGYRSPLVCLWIQVTPSGCVHVLDEYVRSFLPITAHAREILSRDPGPVETTYVDPAGRARESTSGQACTELLAAAGIPCVSRGSVLADGLELIRAALAPAYGETTLMVHPRCVRLIEAFENYHYPPPGAPGDPEAPVKDGPDHLLDSLRYFFVNRARPRCAMRRMAY